MENIIENNLLIAKFMGAKFSLSSHSLWRHELWLPIHGVVNYTAIGSGNGKIIHYHDSWDWLMPVVEKIESLDSTSVVFETDNLVIITTIISKSPYKVKQHSSIGNQHSKIQAVYNTVVEFIKWYSNEQN